jgi:hypothetical protein
MWECRNAWLGMAKYPDDVEHIFAFGTAAWELYQDVRRSTRMCFSNGDRQSIRVIGEPSTSVGGWNRAYEASSGQIVIQLSDDMLPFQDWDVSVRECIGDVSAPRVLGCAPKSPAGAQGGLLTLAICTRAYCEQKGYFVYPEYHGVFEDNDFTQAAIMDGVLVDSYSALVFEHKWGGHSGDDTYKRQNSKHGWYRGNLVYAARTHACFPAIARDNDGTVNTAQVHGDMVAEDEQAQRFMQQIRLWCDCAEIRNLPFEKDSYRDLFMRGEWMGALDGALALIEKYRGFNGGDMALEGLSFVRDWCDQISTPRRHVF